MPDVFQSLHIYFPLILNSHPHLYWEGFWASETVGNFPGVTRLMSESLCSFHLAPLPPTLLVQRGPVRRQPVWDSGDRLRSVFELHLGHRSENGWRWGGASVERMGDSLLLLLQKLCSRKPAEGTACSLIVEWVVVGAAALKVVSGLGSASRL